MPRVLAVDGDMAAWIAVLVNIALIAYLALFPAIFALVTRRLVIGHGRAALMWSPLVWVATELGRTWIFTGFPWVLLGYSQASVLPIAQLASVFGVYGVSMLVASVNAAAATVVSSLSRTGSRRPPQGGHYVPLIVVVAVVMVVAVWGSRRAAAAEWTHKGTPV